MRYRGKERRRLDPKTGRLTRVIGPRRRLVEPPPPLRQPGVQFDNLALVPGSLLPFKKRWQQLANTLPKGQVLIILPLHDRPQRKTFEKIARLFEAKGHLVTTLPVEQFL